MKTCEPCCSSRTLITRKLKAHLILLLGARCARCPATQHLQFDLIVSDGGKHHALDYHSRVRFYVQQFSKENLQLLCPACHVAKTLDDIARQRMPRSVTCPNCGSSVSVNLR